MLSYFIVVARSALWNLSSCHNQKQYHAGCGEDGRLECIGCSCVELVEIVRTGWCDAVSILVTDTSRNWFSVLVGAVCCDQRSNLSVGIKRCSLVFLIMK